MMHSQSSRLDTIYHSDVTNLLHVKIASNQTFTDANVVLYENTYTSPFQRKDDAVLTFLLDGTIDSTYEGINYSFQARSRTCTFIYGPHDNEHQVYGQQYIDSIAIGINKRFFHDLLQSEDKWMEGIIDKIEKLQPFSFTKEPYRLTSEMYATLLKIRGNKLPHSLGNLYLQGLISELLVLQFQEIELADKYQLNTVVREADKRKLQELKAYIETNYLEDLSLNSLAHIAGLNTFKIKSGFKALYQISVFEYIRSLRMKYGLMLLQDGAQNVSDVAHILGYEHVQHFSTAFKKHFGTSPKNFKF